MSLDNLFGSLAHIIDVKLVTDNDSLSDRNLAIDNGPVSKLKFGSGAGQANKIYSAKVSIAASATLTLDLDASTLLDPFGNTLNFANVKSIRISHLKASLSSDINLKGSFMTTRFGASFSAPIAVGGSFAWHDVATGLVVTAATGDEIDIINNDGANIATVLIDIFGV